MVNERRKDSAFAKRSANEPVLDEQDAPKHDLLVACCTMIAIRESSVSEP